MSQAAVYVTDRMAGTVGTGTKGYYYSTAGTKQYYNKAARPVRETAVAPHRSGLAASPLTARKRIPSLYESDAERMGQNPAAAPKWSRLTRCGGGRAGLRASLVRRTCARSCSTCRGRGPSRHRARAVQRVAAPSMAGKTAPARTSQPSDQAGRACVIARCEELAPYSRASVGGAMARAEKIELMTVRR